MCTFFLSFSLSCVRYGVRKAFKAASGCKLIVADYGQLELRVLAHMV
jgi:DNA polymerase I-like protein with 3'-5' exonuclease and polymerase domains